MSIRNAPTDKMVWDSVSKRNPFPSSNPQRKVGQKVDRNLSLNAQKAKICGVTINDGNNTQNIENRANKGG